MDTQQTYHSLRHSEPQSAQAHLNDENLTFSEWSADAGHYERATTDFHRLNRRARVLRSRVHFNAEVSLSGRR